MVLIEYEPFFLFYDMYFTLKQYLCSPKMYIEGNRVTQWIGS